MALAPPPPPALPAFCPPRPQCPVPSTLRPSFMKEAVNRAPWPPKLLGAVEQPAALPAPPPASVTVSCAPPGGVVWPGVEV